jgi:hypothetical protein
VLSVYPQAVKRSKLVLLAVLEMLTEVLAVAAVPVLLAVVAALLVVAAGVEVVVRLIAEPTKPISLESDQVMGLLSLLLFVVKGKK